MFSFTSGETDLQDLITQIAATEPEAIFFIASPVDTALMVQYSRQQGIEALLFSSSWAQTEELLAKGGQAIEGLELISTYNPQTTYPSFQPFVEQ